MPLNFASTKYQNDEFISECSRMCAFHTYLMVPISPGPSLRCMDIIIFPTVFPHTRTSKPLAHHTILAKKRLRRDSDERRVQTTGDPTSRMRRKREAELKSRNAKRKTASAAGAVASGGTEREAGATTGFVIPRNHVAKPLSGKNVTCGACGVVEGGGGEGQPRGIIQIAKFQFYGIYLNVDHERRCW